MSEDLLTSSEVARLLRVHPKHLYRLLRRGLPGHRVGRGHWRFHKHEVLRWIDRREPAGSSLERIEVELAPGGAPLGPGSNRVVVGRVGARLIAHSVARASVRSADALVEAEAPVVAPRERVQASLLTPVDWTANVLVAGCAPVLGIVLDRLERKRNSGRSHWIVANSTAALELLEGGFVHVAGVHLEDADAGVDHPAILRERFPSGSLHLVKLIRWRTGLLLRHRDRGPRPGVADLVGVKTRWVQREPGAGARCVAERALSRVGTSIDALSTALVVSDHRAIAQAVALGVADVGVAVESVARELDLAFVPLAEEGFDLVVAADSAAEPAVERMLSSLDDRVLRREVGATGPYDTASMGHSMQL